MVKIISQKDQQIINEATKKAEATSKAEIVTVIVPASDTYAHYIMICGFIFASLVDLILWQQKIITQFPTLLCLQLLFASLCPLIPGMRTLTLGLLPKEIYHRHAAQMAAEKRLAATKEVNSTTPVLLIFISLAEHYIHLFPNTVIHEKVSDKEWDSIVRKLKYNIPKMKLANACALAIEESGDILAGI